MFVVLLVIGEKTADEGSEGGPDDGDETGGEPKRPRTESGSTSSALPLLPTGGAPLMPPLLGAFRGAPFGVAPFGARPPPLGLPPGFAAPPPTPLGLPPGFQAPPQLGLPPGFQPPPSLVPPPLPVDLIAGGIAGSATTLGGGVPGEQSEQVLVYADADNQMEEHRAALRKYAFVDA